MKKLFLIPLFIFIGLSVLFGNPVGEPPVAKTNDPFRSLLPTSGQDGESRAARKNIAIADANDVNNYKLTFEEIEVGATLPSSMYPYGWTTYDADGGTVWGDFSAFGVIGSSCSFFVYSHALVGETAAPYEGDKCGIAMTNNPGVGNRSYNNDWLISPQVELKSNSSFSLYVRSYTANYGLEKYKIGVSTTTAEPGSFTIIGETRFAPAEWTKVTVDLSEYDGQSVYVAVNYVGENAFIFMVDNLEINTQSTAAEIESFSFGSSDAEPANINSEEKTISITVLPDTDISALKAEFSLSDGAVATVNNVIQESGVTENDFSSTVTYKVTAEDGVTVNDWNIEVSGHIVGVTEAVADEVIIYPNPASHVLNIDRVSGATISILNLLGQTVKVVNNASDYQQIDISDLTPGAYVIKITLDKSTLSYKVLVE